MGKWTGSRLQLLTAFAGIVAIPFYLGLIHVTAPQMLLYSGVAGTSMAAGGYLDSPRDKRGSLTAWLQEALLWSLVVVALGGTAYAVALIF